MSFKTKSRERWMSLYEALAVERFPQLRGKIDWDTATFFYNSGLTVEEAVEKLKQIDLTQ